MPKKSRHVYTIHSDQGTTVVEASSPIKAIKAMYAEYRRRTIKRFKENHKAFNRGEKFKMTKAMKKSSEYKPGVQKILISYGRCVQGK